MLLLRLLIVATCYFVSYTSASIRNEDITKHPGWSHLPHDKCGLGSKASRVIGGKVAALGQFPWMVRIGKIENPKFLTNFCGGTIISKYYILTAAHCFSPPVKTEILRVTLGERTTNYRCKETPCGPTIQYTRVTKVIANPNYNQATYSSDVALLKLATPIEFNELMSPICLPFAEGLNISSYLNEHAQVAGWGVTDLVSLRSSTSLKYSSLPITTIEKCLTVFKHVNESQICVDVENSSDACYGDSGGPLMKILRLGSDGLRRYYQLGITSFGKKCALYPSIYTNVPHYLTWVLDQILANGN